MFMEVFKNATEFVAAYFKSSNWFIDGNPVTASAAQLNAAVAGVDVNDGTHDVPAATSIAFTGAIVAAGATGIADVTIPAPGHAIIAGGTAGNHTATGVKVGDRLDEVLYLIGAGTAITDISDLTAEFTITGTGTINNTSGTNTSGGKILANWTGLVP
jgi:hypothetical protein